MTRSASSKTARASGSREARSRPMFTYWLPCPGKRKASFPAAGPLPRKIPCDARAVRAFGASGLERLLRLSQLLEKLLADPKSIDEPLARGKDVCPGARGGGNEPFLHPRHEGVEIAPEGCRRVRAEGRDAAEGGLLGSSRLRGDGGGNGRGNGNGDLVASFRRQHPRNVLLEDEVEVRPAETVGRDAAAPGRPVLRLPVARARGRGGRGSSRNRCSGSASRRSAWAGASSRGRHRPP